MEQRRQTQILYERQAEIVKAIAHPLRIAVIDYLRDGEQCVCDIAEYAGSERSNVSRHLAVMLGAGIVQHRKEGLKVMYRLTTPCILGFFECVTNCLRERARDEAEFITAIQDVD